VGLRRKKNQPAPTAPTTSRRPTAARPISSPAPPPDLRAGATAAAGCRGGVGAAGGTGGGVIVVGGSGGGPGRARGATVGSSLAAERAVAGVWIVGLASGETEAGAVGASTWRTVGAVPGRVRARRSSASSRPVW